MKEFSKSTKPAAGAALLAWYDAICRAIAEAYELDEVKLIGGQALCLGYMI